MTDLEEFLFIREKVAAALSPGAKLGPEAYHEAERLMDTGLINKEQILKDRQIVIDARQRAHDLRQQGLHR